MDKKVNDAYNCRFLKKEGNIERLVRFLSNEYSKTQACFKADEVWDIYTKNNEEENKETYAIYRNSKNGQKSILFGKNVEDDFLRDFTSKFLDSDNDNPAKGIKKTGHYVGLASIPLFGLACPSTTRSSSAGSIVCGRS